LGGHRGGTARSFREKRRRSPPVSGEKTGGNIRMNKQQLAFKIWESANRMRSKIEANEYKDYILGFIFYKFLSDKELNYLRDNDWTENLLPQLTENDTESVVNIQGSTD
jgi:hypothetical protein